jgi:integrase/recombinase XerC
VEAFLLSRQVANCSPRTVGIYMHNLSRFVRAIGDDLGACSALTVQRYLRDLRGKLAPVSVHQHFRALKTFFTWCVDSGLQVEHPMRGMVMRVPRTLPRVPDDDDVRRLLLACPETFEGRRNRALIALLADSGLRISEALRLRIEDVNCTSLAWARR